MTHSRTQSLTKFENTLRTLSELQKIKMAAEIDTLKSTVGKTRCEKVSIECCLDMKQNEWTEVKDTKFMKETKTNKTSFTSTDGDIRTSINSPFLGLDVEKVPEVDEGIPSNDNSNQNRGENNSKDDVKKVDDGKEVKKEN